MSRYFRCNPHLGCKYEITEKQALRKINNTWWMPAWDEYWQRYKDDAWYNMKDPERDWIFKED